MEKEKIIVLAGLLEVAAGYKIVDLKEKEQPCNPDSWVIEITPLSSFQSPCHDIAEKINEGIKAALSQAFKKD